MATPSASSYNADAIEVLSGLDPVRKRPGMYTDTSRPNHLAQEVIDNSVDEALAGHAKSVQVILHADHSLEVSDDGRGMPVDIHPEEGVSGVELILTKLHAGGKFSNKNYQFSGGLHGVGISVVNALSTQVRVKVKRDGNEYQMTFADGFKATELEVVGSVGKRNTAQRVFRAGPEVFRFTEILHQPPQACAQGQGGAVSGAVGQLRGQGHGREGRVALRGWPAFLPGGLGQRIRAPAGRTVLRQPGR